MKLKVHAQRKFAQGAFIPPSASATAVERRVDVTPSKDENKNVYFNRMSAVSLLDIVAFQNMHSHTEPVVLLERLEEFQESMSQPVAEVNGTYNSPVKNTAANGNANHSKSKPAKPLRFIRPKRTGGLNQRAQRPQSMHLRSRLGSSFKPKSRAVKKKCREKPSVAARALRRRRMPSPAESYDLDDDKPLTYIAQVLRRTVALRSDRNLRKRRGEELASTSKRRARVPIPTRPQKPTKPSIQAASFKANHAGSDSDDTDAGTTNGPTKPKQSNGPKSPPYGSNGLKVNEGASTSKQYDTASTRKELGNRPTHKLTDTRRTSSSDGSTHTLTPLRSTSRARQAIQKDDLDLRGTSRGQPMMRNNNLKLNKLKRSPRPTAQSNDLRGGPRARRIVLNDLNRRGLTLPETAIQNNDRDLEVAPLAQLTIQSQELDPRSGTRSQLSLQSNDLQQSSRNQTQSMNQNNDHKHKNNIQVQTTSQNIDLDPRNRMQGQATSHNNDLDLRSSTQAQPARQKNDLKLRSSKRAHLASPNNNLELGTNLRGQSTGLNNDFKLRSSSRGQLTNQNDLKLRSSSRAQPSVQNICPDVRCSSRSPPISCSTDLNHRNSPPSQSNVQNNNIDLNNSTNQPTNHNNDIDNKNSIHAQFITKNKNIGLKNSTQGQQAIQNYDFKLRSSSRAQPTSHNELKLRSSSRAQQAIQNNNFDLGGNPQVSSTSLNIDLDPSSCPRAQPTVHNHNNKLELRSSSRIHNNDLDRGDAPALTVRQNNYLELRSSSRTKQNSDLDLGSTPVQLTTQNKFIELKSISGAQPMLQNDLDLRSSLPAPSTSQNNDIDLRSCKVPTTSQNIDLEPSSSSQGQPTNQYTDLNIRSSTQAQSKAQKNDLSSIQAQPSNQSNELQHTSSSQAQPASHNNDIVVSSSSSDQQTIQSNPDLGGSLEAQPATQNDQEFRDGTPARPTIQNNVGPGATTRGNNRDPRRNIRLLLQNDDLDLRVNSRPLSAIQNYDWDFGSLRSQPMLQNNFLGLRTNFVARPTVRNDNVQQRPNAGVQLTIRNELGLGGSAQSLQPIRNVDANPRADTHNNELEPATSTARDLDPRASFEARSTFRNDVPVRTPPRARLAIRSIDLGFGERSRPRPTIRNDSINVGGGWVMRPTFRNDSFDRVRSTLLNDEIRPRPRLRPTAHNDLDLRVPIQPVRDQARYWNMKTNGPERTREQQMRTESLAAVNRAARAERMAAAADRERAMTLDEALRECVLTAQAVTAEEVKPYQEQEDNDTEEVVRGAQKRKNDDFIGMQRRQAIAARQQQLSEGSPFSRRTASRRTHTDTGAMNQHRAPEREPAPSPQRHESEEPEPGPSKVRRKKQFSPGDPGSSSQTRPSESEPELRMEPQPEPEPGQSKVLRKKPTSSGDTATSSQRQEKEFQPHAESQSQSVPEPESGPSKMQKKQATSPGDPGPSQPSPERDPEPQPGPSKLRRKKVPSLLEGMIQRARLRTPDRQLEARISPARDRVSLGIRSQERPKESSESTSETTKNSAETTATLTSSRLSPSEQSDIEIPADRIARCATPRRPIVEGWLKNVLREHVAEELPHSFKVPRIPAARKSVERRTVKLYGNERESQSVPNNELTSSPNEVNEEEPANPANVFAARPKKDLPFPCRENLTEPIIQPKNACLSKHYTTVRSIVHATDSELADRCGHCIYCTRVDKIRKLSNLVQNQRKPAVTTNEVYDFDADREDSHENTRLYNFRQNRKAKLLESPKQDAPKDPVYLDVLPPQNPHIIEITSVQMPNQNKPMLRARLIRKTDANLENEFSLIEHENLLDQLLEIKIANTDQTARKPVPVETEEPVAGPSNAEAIQTDATDSTDDVELNYETDDSSEFLARLQTRLNTRRRTEQTNFRAKAAEKPSLKKSGRTEPKKAEPAKKGKGLRRSHDETMRVEMPNNFISDNLSRCFREAPIFFPTEEEFLDPLAYFEKIFPVASQFGLCKVVAPSGFKPKCTITDDVRFNVANQYISRLYCRWGAASKEMCAIKAYLAEQKVFFTRPPLIEGIELNLPKLYRTVQRHGGLKKVIEKKRWGRVAEDMRFPRGPRSAKRIDQLYVKHLLPYDTLSSAERRELMDTVEHSWNRNYKKMLNRASNPLHRQRRLMGESESSDEMDTDEDANLAYALAEAEDCVVTGRCMKLSVFKKVAANVMCTLFPHAEQPSPKDVEQEYWTLVSGAAEHVCVNAASIDTGEEGYGFPRSKHDPYSRHPWNLKMFSQNSGNVLRSLGPVLGVTVPTLHLGMVFATSCWHRDPHGLPWVEYMHHGPPKIWYGIPDELSAEFRKAVETLCPTSCQNKSIWLPSDITMIPPTLLHAARVPLSRVVQSPGEFIVVCPKAYSSSIATGYTESESVYFAPTQWLTDVSDVFQELRDSCEPTMFSLSQLLLAVALDSRTPAHVLAGVSATLRDIVCAELARRDALARYGVELAAPEQNRAAFSQARKRPAGAWNVREQDECEVCRTTLYLSKVTGLTSKRSSLCLEHALLLIDKDKKRYARNVSGVVATIFVLRAELEDAVRRVERRLRQ